MLQVDKKAYLILGIGLAVCLLLHFFAFDPLRYVEKEKQLLELKIELHKMHSGEYGVICGWGPMQIQCEIDELEEELQIARQSFRKSMFMSPEKKSEDMKAEL